MYKKIIVSAFAFVFVVFLAAPSTAKAQTIVDVASGDESFSSLVAAVVAQDLAETLASEGPFTVFAPTNEAFASLPSFVGQALERDPSLLSDILLYHVVADDLDSGEVLSMRRIESVEGSHLMVRSRGGNPMINNANIIATDVEASNGTIHVIDTVLVPPTLIRSEIDYLRGQIRELIDRVTDLVRYYPR